MNKKNNAGIIYTSTRSTRLTLLFVVSFFLRLFLVSTFSRMVHHIGAAAVHIEVDTSVSSYAAIKIDHGIAIAQRHVLVKCVRYITYV